MAQNDPIGHKMWGMSDALPDDPKEKYLGVGSEEWAKVNPDWAVLRWTQSQLLPGHSWARYAGLWFGHPNDGYPEKYGRIIFSPGEVYEGELVMGHLEGKGTRWFIDGSVYQGKFNSGKKEGPFTVWEPGGAVKLCKYKEGKEEGVGVMWSYDRKKAYRTESGQPKEIITDSAALNLAKKIGLPVPGDAPLLTDKSTTLLKYREEYKDAGPRKLIGYTAPKKSSLDHLKYGPAARGNLLYSN